jgi:spoIIIJ-associated protein
MNANRASLEVIAPSVEEAVAKGLSDLGLDEDAVDIEVLDAGSRGLFGLGLRQARVRLTIKQQSPVITERPAEPPLAPAVEPLMPEVEAVETERADPSAAQAEAVEKPAPRPAEGVDNEMLLRVARETVEELLMKMRVRARVTASFASPEDDQDRAPVLVDVRGDDLSILIGPKAETLNALQYITSLIVGKEIGHSAPLIVDVEGYRARRSQQIRQLARRMADQAVRTGRRQVLEPMPANERRLIHIELRDHPNVTTESVGDEPRRKVTIIPK